VLAASDCLALRRSFPSCQTKVEDFDSPVLVTKCFGLQIAMNDFFARAARESVSYGDATQRFRASQRIDPQAIAEIFTLKELHHRETESSSTPNS
jgi:hypothetical protein